MTARLALLAALLIGLLASCSKGSDGSPGSSCTVRDNGDGTATIACGDGTSVTVAGGQDGTSCTVADDGHGTKTISCADGTTVTVADGANGGNVEVSLRHGAAAAAAERASATGRRPARAFVTAASADPAGVVSVDFRVEDLAGEPVASLATIGASVAKLVPPGPGEASSRWVSYVQRTQTVTGSSFPNPAGTQADQGWREEGGAPRLANHGDGTYTYVFATDLANVVVGSGPIPYERDRTHRVTVWALPSSGWIADASLDFVPDGSPMAERREIVPTSACASCHGEELPGHGDSRSLESCAACHVAGSADPQGGESLELAVMIHKIHAGGELPSVRGPDGDPWATADNGTYAIWGDDDVRVDWWKVGFPAVLENCAKCHQGAGAQVDAWRTRPSRAACGSCHDDVDFAETDPVSPSYHAGGAQADDGSCMTAACHGVDHAAGVAHDWTVRDPRNVPEFTAELWMSPPANGQYYDGDEAPLVTVFLKRDGVPIPDHRIQEGAPQGCVPAGDPPACPPDTDGKFANTSFFVHGPRARRMPVLTTAARAQVVSGTVGPWDLSAPGAALIVKVDQGEDVVLHDGWGTRLAGTVTVPVSGWPFSSVAAVTAPEVVAWLNANSAFRARAIAAQDGNGKLVIRSRNLGSVHAIQLVASAVTTAVFAGNVTPRTPAGSTASNVLAQRSTPSLEDPKVTRLPDRIEYQLDPVTDLAPGTYVVSVEIAQLGRMSDASYRTPTVEWRTFQVKTAAPEPPPAGNCGSCHRGPDGKGAVAALSRHHKVLGDDAIDQCGACHDYQPQLVQGQTGFPTDGGWTGARPISKRIHAVHFGSQLAYPLGTVDAPAGDPVGGRNWDISYPRDPRTCEACHPAGATSGTWATGAARLPCMGCHDGDAASVHMRLETWDPTPGEPWSGDEQESCAACH